MKRLTLPILASLALLGPATVHASTLSLSLTNATIKPGGTTTVDVLISSDDDAVLDIFGLVVRLAPASGRLLEFVEPSAPIVINGTDGQLVDSAYLFNGDSGAQGEPPAGHVTSSLNPNDTYTGGDGTLSFEGVAVTSTPTLLARLEITANSSLPPLVGDVFSVVIDIRASARNLVAEFLWWATSSAW